MASVYTIRFQEKNRENLLAPDIASMKATTCSVEITIFSDTLKSLTNICLLDPRNTEMY